MAACESISRFIDGMDFEEFCLDDKTVYAVMKAFEIIGEAARNIPTTMRRQYQEIPWDEMIVMRDRLVHGYRGVRLDVVWLTIQNDIPPLKPLLAQAIGEAGQQ